MPDINLSTLTYSEGSSNLCRECCNQLNEDPIRAARRCRWGLSELEFNDIFDNLQKLFGVSESIRHSLWSEIQDLPDGGFEFRIQGKLGFGGKFWYDPYRGYYVNNYREDLTKELADKIKLMNEFLTEKLSRGLK